MKKISKLVILPLIAISLTGCDLFKLINDLLYKDVEEYYRKNNFQETTDEDEFNTILQSKMYTWRKKIQTYTNTDASDEVLTSPQSDRFVEYKRNNQTTYYSNYGEKFVIHYGNKPSLSMTFEEQDEINFDGEVLRYIDSERFVNDMDEEHADILRMQEDNNGYLFVTNHNTMFYLAKDFKTVYPYISYTQKFEYDNKSIEVSESELLTNTLASLTEKPKLAIPLPKDTSFHHKDHEDSDGEWTAYNVIIPNIKGVDYASLLEERGFEVYRGEYHGMLDFDGENGGEWVAYDQNLEFKIHIQYQSSIAPVKDGTNNSGVELYVQPMNGNIGLFGRSVSTQTDWKDDEKAFMQEKYGFVLPFINIGRKYTIPEEKRPNGEHPLLSALDMDSACYWIFDNFYKDVITESYGSLLENAGFTAYVPPVTRKSPKEEWDAWFYSDDVKYFECYLNEELQTAVKFGFDDIYGNFIKVFKYSDLIPWNYHLDD